MEALKASGEIDLPVQYLGSALHMDPPRLRNRLDERISRVLRDGDSVLLLYGDCHPYMVDQEAAEHVARVRGINCPEILLGKALYRKLRADGAFFLFREWTERWQELLLHLDGLNEYDSREILRQRHNKFMYLDTGIRPVPEEALAACADHFGLPYSVFPVALDRLRDNVADAARRIGQQGAGR